MTETTSIRLQNAIAHHQAGRLIDAQILYRQVLAEIPYDNATRHNLGMVCLGLGQLKEALALLEEAYIVDPTNPIWESSSRMVAATLFEQRYWELAQPWLQRLLTVAKDDPQALNTLRRISPRQYLSPEIVDSKQHKILRRYSPREAETYQYVIDIVGTCNLRCPTCPVGNSQDAQRSKGFMSPELFERILAKITAESPVPNPEIWLFNWGEPLLHPQLPELIGIVKAHGFPVHLSTNLNTTHGIAELAKAAPTAIKISLSGFTQESYAKTHVRGDIRLLKANMYLLRYSLDKYAAETRVWVGHHLYRFNLDQQAAVAAVCAELGYEYHPIAAFYQPLERLLELLQGKNADTEIMQQLLEHPSTYLQRIKNQRSGNYDCELRFNQTVINFDGTLALCCNVYESSQMLGAHFIDTPREEIETLKYQHPFCSTCMQHGLDYSVAELPE